MRKCKTKQGNFFFSQNQNRMYRNLQGKASEMVNSALSPEERASKSCRWGAEEAAASQARSHECHSFNISDRVTWSEVKMTYFLSALLGHCLGSPETESHEPLHHTYGRQYYLQYPTMMVCSMAWQSIQALMAISAHFQDARKFKPEISTGLGLSYREPDGFGIGGLQVPVYGITADACVRLASVH